MLTATDPLPCRPARILVAGVTGSGKTTLASHIGELLGIPHTEIDSLFHGPDWTPRESFAADVEQFTAAPDWVTEWQYGQARALLAERADTLIWLDFPIPLSLWRLIRRTVTRRLLRQKLWNGNIEPPFHRIFTDRNYILRWGWRTRAKCRTMVPALETTAPHLQLVRLRSPREVHVWLENLHRAPTTG